MRQVVGAGISFAVAGCVSGTVGSRTLRSRQREHHRLVAAIKLVAVHVRRPQRDELLVQPRPRFLEWDVLAERHEVDLVELRDLLTAAALVEECSVSPAGVGKHIVAQLQAAACSWSRPACRRRTFGRRG